MATTINWLGSASSAIKVIVTILLLLLPLFASPQQEETKHAVSKWKAPNPQTPTQLAKQWHDEDEALNAYIASSVPAVLEHTGSEAFDAHLRGVQAILRYWDAPKHLYNSGLFHSIYGTEGFQGFALPLTERDAIRDLIGDKAEKLCWIFCMVDRSTVDETIFNWSINDAMNNKEEQFTFVARPELGRFHIHVNKSEWVDFIELTLADWLEQVQGAAETTSAIFWWKKGEAYTYRRTAYAKMVEILTYERRDRLAHIVSEMHADVYSTEGSATRHLVQTRTPPPSDAAKLALEALRGAGEDIPVDFSPQPIRKDDDTTTCSDNTTAVKELTGYDNNNNVYETSDALNMYLDLHYPLSAEPMLLHANAPTHALRFPQRVAQLLQFLKPVRTNNRALDIGCSVGGSSFELAKSFDHVEAFDYSESFIAAAKRIQYGEEVTFQVTIEGHITQEVSAVLDPGVHFDATKRINFFHGDACDLSNYAEDESFKTKFDGVIMANLLCRLPDPHACLNGLDKIVNKGGVVVITTPLSWMEEYTPKSKWLGGYVDTADQPVYSKDKLTELMEDLGFVKIHEEQMPLIIREHQRKYQYIVSEATGWRRR